MNIQFIGPSGQSILTTFHPAEAASRSIAVLLAPPIGTEYQRTHWAMRRLATQLCRAGFPVMRVDYRGLGDSCGEISQIDSLDIWRQDLCTAADELSEQSGCQNLAIVGLRLGAALAMQVAHQLDRLTHIVGWEAVLDGDEYLDSLRHMQWQVLDLWHQPVQSIQTDSHEEILGSLYSRSLLQEIAKLSPRDLIVEHVRCDLLESDSGSSKGYDQPRWDDLRYLELAWLPTASIKQIVQLLDRSYPQ